MLSCYSAWTSPDTRDWVSVWTCQETPLGFGFKVQLFLSVCGIWFQNGYQNPQMLQNNSTWLNTIEQWIQSVFSIHHSLASVGFQPTHASSRVVLNSGYGKHTVFPFMELILRYSSGKSPVSLHGAVHELMCLWSKGWQALPNSSPLSALFTFSHIALSSSNA